MLFAKYLNEMLYARVNPQIDRLKAELERLPKGSDLYNRKEMELRRLESQKIQKNVML